MAEIEGAATSGTTSRRQLLKMGAAVGVAAWAIPAVQVISMGSAAADTASGGSTSTPPAGGGTVTPPAGGGTVTPPAGGTGPFVAPAVAPASYPNTGVLGETLPKTGAGAGVVETVVAGAGLVALGIGAVVASRQNPGVAGDEQGAPGAV